MTAPVENIGAPLSRAIILRQTGPDRWRVDGYERQDGRWRCTWLLRPDDTADRARRYAAWLSRHTGLPVTEQPTGGRVRLVDGTRGKIA